MCSKGVYYVMSQLFVFFCCSPLVESEPTCLRHEKLKFEKGKTTTTTTKEEEEEEEKKRKEKYFCCTNVERAIIPSVQVKMFASFLRFKVSLRHRSGAL